MLVGFYTFVIPRSAPRSRSENAGYQSRWRKRDRSVRLRFCCCVITGYRLQHLFWYAPDARKHQHTVALDRRSRSACTDLARGLGRTDLDDCRAFSDLVWFGLHAACRFRRSDFNCYVLGDIRDGSHLHVTECTLGQHCGRRQKHRLGVCRDATRCRHEGSRGTVRTALGSKAGVGGS